MGYLRGLSDCSDDTFYFLWKTWNVCIKFSSYVDSFCDPQKDMPSALSLLSDGSQCGSFSRDPIIHERGYYDVFPAEGYGQIPAGDRAALEASIKKGFSRYILISKDTEERVIMIAVLVAVGLFLLCAIYFCLKDIKKRCQAGAERVQRSCANCIGSIFRPRQRYRRMPGQHEIVRMPGIEIVPGGVPAAPRAPAVPRAPAAPSIPPAAPRGPAFPINATGSAAPQVPFAADEQLQPDPRGASQAERSISPPTVRPLVDVNVYRTRK